MELSAEREKRRRAEGDLEELRMLSLVRLEESQQRHHAFMPTGHRGY